MNGLTKLILIIFGLSALAAIIYIINLEKRNSRLNKLSKKLSIENGKLKNDLKCAINDLHNNERNNAAALSSQAFRYKKRISELQDKIASLEKTKTINVVVHKNEDENLDIKQSPKTQSDVSNKKYHFEGVKDEVKVYGPNDTEAFLKELEHAAFEND